MGDCGRLSAAERVHGDQADATHQQKTAARTHTDHLVDEAKLHHRTTIAGIYGTSEWRLLAETV